MTIWPVLFEAFLKCPTKCWLRSVGEAASGNRYDDWVQAQNKAYRAAGTGLLLSHRPQDECAISPSEEDLKGARWGLAIDLPARTPEFPQPRNSRLESAVTSHSAIPTPHSAIEMSLVPSSATDQASAARAVFTAEIRLHAVERVPSEGRGRPAQFIPLRFVFTNKLTKDDKLLLALDAFALSEAMGRKIAVGKIIHGPDHAMLRVKTLALAGEVQKRLEKIAVLLSSPAPPDLVLNRHCTECEFQARCRQKALEKDDLSLLAGMTEKERKRLHNKGIFTVTQLSYTFRPRRRPKRLRDKREKYHHSLKALAIREKKIHIVGSPELKIEGTPIYLDVEGLPDRDFYYLIGMRIGNGESAVQHSLWADSVEDEGKIWKEFLGILETVEKPVLIHYGSYEAEFLRRMQDRHGGPANGCEASKAIQSPLNLLSFMFGQIYFPTYSNTIKEIGNYLGFRWSEAGASGQLSILWRLDWEVSKRHNVRDKLIAYNSEDCEALHELAESCQEICRKDVAPLTLDPQSTVQVDSLKQSGSYKWGRNTFSIPEFHFINEAAYWTYQRDRIYVKTNPRLRRSLESRKPQKMPLDRDVECNFRPNMCPDCRHPVVRKAEFRQKIVHDLHFSRRGVRRCTTRFRFYHFTCAQCGRRIRFPNAVLPKNKYGPGFVAFLIYYIVDLGISQGEVAKCLNDICSFRLDGSGQLNKVKARAAQSYKSTYEGILKKLVHGDLLHADETTANVQGKRAYVWVLTNLEEVAYVYSETREADVLSGLLEAFSGVLISDFYSAYDSLNCPQQKCLIHLMRDVNNDLLKYPFNLELRSIALEFGALVKSILVTVDRFGLKKWFLRKHRRAVDRFLTFLSAAEFVSEVSIGYQKRFKKHRDSLFTFLDHDGVPWNNNNAEHAVKAFARLRRVIGGTSTEIGTRDYLILLSICETCRYKGLNFLQFLRSGEKDIDTFADSRCGRRRSSPTGEPKASPADESVEK